MYRKSRLLPLRGIYCWRWWRRIRASPSFADHWWKSYTAAGASAFREKAKVPMDLVVDRKKEPQFARSRKKPLGFLRESVKTKMRGPPLKFTLDCYKESRQEK